MKSRISAPCALGLYLQLAAESASRLFHVTLRISFSDADGNITGESGELLLKKLSVLVLSVNEGDVLHLFVTKDAEHMAVTVKDAQCETLCVIPVSCDTVDVCARVADADNGGEPAALAREIFQEAAKAGETA